MNDEFFRQIEKWNENKEYRMIIGAIEALPESDRSYELDIDLARAYVLAADQEESQEFLGKCTELMRRLKNDGANDPRWYALASFSLLAAERYEEAWPYLERLIALLPESKSNAPEWNGWDYILGICYGEVEAQKKAKAGKAKAATYDEDPLNAEKALEFIIRDCSTVFSA